MEKKDIRPWKIPRPKGMKEFVLDKCQRSNYLFFSYKRERCFCTACRKEVDIYDLPPLAHSDGHVTIPCPECGRDAIPKDMRYGRKGLLDKCRVTWSRGYGPVTFIQVDECVIDYRNVYPEVTIAATEQIRLAKGSQKRYDYEPGGWGGPEWWKPVKAINLRAKPQQGFFGGSSWADILWDDEIKVGTDLRYANTECTRFLDGWWDDNQTIKRVIRYMADFIRYPAIELLEKSGFGRIVFDMADGKRTRAINIRGKDLRTIMRMNNGDIRKLREIDPHIHFLDTIEHVRELVPGAPLEDIKELDAICNVWMENRTWNLIYQVADVKRLMLKILAERRAGESNMNLRDYADYISTTVELGRRLDKRTIYPRNIQQAHDEAMWELAQIQERERELKEREKDMTMMDSFRDAQKRITGMEEPWTLGDYLIRPAATPAELRKESFALSHCVRTYVDKVARGSTSILFIRKVEKPDIPLFTLELAPDGRVVQCRGDHNRSYPEDVGAFIDAWHGWWNRMVKDNRAMA